MAITQNPLTSGMDNSDSNSYVTASVSPASNELLLLAVHSSKVSGGAGDEPDSVTGNGLTWVLMGSTTDAQFRRVSLFRSMGSSPSTGAITIGFPDTQLGCQWALAEFGTDIDTSGSNGSGATNTESNFATNTGSGVSALTVTLAAFSDAGNATYGAFTEDVNQTSWTAGTGFAIIHQVLDSSPNMTMATQWRNDNDTSVDITAPASGRISGIAVELFASAPAATGFTPRSYPRGASRGIMRGAA